MDTSTSANAESEDPVAEPCSAQIVDTHCDPSADTGREVAADMAQIVPPTTLKWNEGRRLVELGVMAKYMSACEDCGQHLNLAYVIGNFYGYVDFVVHTRTTNKLHNIDSMTITLLVKSFRLYYLSI